MRVECERALLKIIKMSGKVLYVGVSPYPYKGKGYWYVDEYGVTQPKTYVWVRMGRHDREQMVYVDCVCWFDKENTPYPYERAKRVLRQATEEERDRAEKAWKEFW